MAWNRVELVGRARKVTVWPLQNPEVNDDKILLKEIGYTLIKKIGHGSFSRVWRAKNSTNLERDFAIKIIRRRKASKEFLEKFLPRELAIIQSVRHPNLLDYYEITDSPNSVYIVMQYAENGTLGELIDRQKFLSEDLSRIFFTQLIDVVEFLHRHGIVHRDIKCENLLLDREYRLLLSDFGFARADVLPGKDGRIYKSNTYCGSYAYASPEILANTPYNPFLADVWCMGMVLYNMLVGAIPYKQTDIKSLIAAKKHPPQFPAVPSVSHISQDFVKRMVTLEHNRSSIPQLRKDPWMLSKFEELEELSKMVAGPSTPSASPLTVDVGTPVQTSLLQTREVDRSQPGTAITKRSK